MPTKPNHDWWDPTRYVTQHSFVYEHGQALVDIADAGPGERVLDVGCGSGQLTAQLAERSAKVLGIDPSANMIEAARSAYSDVHFEVGDVLSLREHHAYDVVFTNATLHWVKAADHAAARIAAALKPGGRFVAEFGASGNMSIVVSAIMQALERLGVRVSAFENPWFNPTVAEYVSILSRAGLEIVFAQRFQRPTQLDGPAGLQGWLEMFARPHFSGLADDQVAEVIERAVEIARPQLFKGGAWYADYVRLRVVAVKPPTDDKPRALGRIGSAE